jgi:hypothetical protein
MVAPGMANVAQLVVVLVNALLDVDVLVKFTEILALKENGKYLSLEGSRRFTFNPFYGSS